MKKKNNIIKSFAIALLGGLSLCSCNDFLTIYPTDKTIGEEFWKSKDDVDQMVNGAYQSMLSDGIIERFIMWGAYRSDELQKASDLKDNTMDNISNVDLYPSSGYNSWSSFYNVINTCNLVLNHAESVTEIDPEFTAGDLQSVRAQMLGLRALCHFYLIRSFRDIPYVTKSYENTDDMGVDGQLAPDSTLQCCINDLEEAIPGCYKYGTFSTSDWRTAGFLSKDAIHAILADVYLWRASLWANTDKEKAKTYYQACIDNANKVLDSHRNYYETQIKGTTAAANETAEAPYYLIDGNQANYQIFSKGNSRESILELQFDGTNNSDNMVRKYYYKWEKSTSTYGMVEGTKMVGTSVGDDPKPASTSASLDAYYKSENDYRFYDNSYEVNDDNISSFPVKKMIDIGSISSYIPTRKKGDTHSLSRLFDNFKQNWIIYRITDVMLMKAEAEIQLAGSDDKKFQHAFNIVQAVNKRSIDPQALSKDSLVYKDNYNKQDKLEQLCLQERARELCYEGKRWYDLLRYSYRHMKGVDPTKTLYLIDPNGNNYPSLDDASNNFKDILQSKYGTNIVKFKNEAYLYWPILQSDIKNNKLLHQNPVWAETKTSERQGE